MEISVESLETPALTKAQLADLLFEQIGLNKRESKDMVDAFFDLIVESLIVDAKLEDLKLGMPMELTIVPFNSKHTTFAFRPERTA